MRIGWDVDGVLFNFGDSVQRYLEHIGRGHLWKSGPTPTPYWEFYKDWGWTNEEFVDLCNSGADEGFIFCGPTRPGAVEAMNSVKEMGHHNIIITDRQFGTTPESSYRNTRNWLKEHGFIYDELIFSSDKTIVPTDMFIEDKIENYDALLSAGVEVYLINRAWNHTPEGDSRNRISTLDEYVAAVAANTLLDISVNQGYTYSREGE